MLIFNMINIKSVYDLISLYTHYIALDTVYKGISGRILYPIGLVITLSIEGFLKKMTTNSSFLPFKRPNGACDCDLFNSGGLVDHKSGFPSGHVASTSFYMTLLYYDSIEESLFKENNNLKLLIYHIPSILMGIARYEKKCHNILQIICGMLLGFYVATILHKNKIHINYRIRKTINK